MNTNLKHLVQEKILNDVFKSVKKDGEWKVLVMDKLGSKIVSSCFKMHNIMSEGITLVEDLMVKREPIPLLEAVYFIKPVEESINMLIDDYSGNIKRYRAAHVFFTEACCDNLFSKLCKSSASKYIKTLKEINISFLPIERQVFTLDSLETFDIFYSKNHTKRAIHLEAMAEQLSTLCVTLGEYPLIRHRLEHTENVEFANLVKKKLDKYKEDNPLMGEGFDKSKSELIILDRGFDVVSPLLHELTYQAMSYDLIDIKNDIYTFNSKKDSLSFGKKEALLDENDELWLQLRHLHIAEVLQTVSALYKKFASEKISSNSQSTVKDVGLMVKKMPQLHKELNNYAIHLSLADECNNAFNKASTKIKQICEAEQNLALDVDQNGEKIKDPMRIIISLLSENDVKIEDKLRLVMLFLLNKNGVSENNLQKLVTHSGMPQSMKESILNLKSLGMRVLIDENNPVSRHKNIPQNRRERDRQTFQFSRWTPIIKDIIEDLIEDRLENTKYPYLMKKEANQVLAGISARPTWQRDFRVKQALQGHPRLIIFIIGGVTYSEMRCAYEVAAENRKWEIFIGSDHITTPNQFLKYLGMNTKNCVEQKSKQQIFSKEEEEDVIKTIEIKELRDVDEESD